MITQLLSVIRLLKYYQLLSDAAPQVGDAGDLLTPYRSKSTLSSIWLGGPASRHGSLNSLFQVALHLPFWRCPSYGYSAAAGRLSGRVRHVRSASRGDYRGTSLMRNTPLVGPYSSPMPRDLWWRVLDIPEAPLGWSDALKRYESQLSHKTVSSIFY